MDKIYLNYAPELKKKYGNHRAGWTFALHGLKKYHISKDALVFDSFVDKSFLWGPGFNQKCHKKPWVGIIHNPPNIPKRLRYKSQLPQRLLSHHRFKLSLRNCKGLFVLSTYLKDWLSKRIEGIPIEVLYHPTLFVKDCFTIEKFRNNPKKKLIHIGYWLRNKTSIFRLKGLELVSPAILPFDNRMKGELNHESNILKQKVSQSQVQKMKYQSIPIYDKMLSENIVFLDLYDSSANNCIVECIVRNTPILINPIPAVKEYLGEKYPFYFHSLEEAVRKANDIDLIKETTTYLKNYKFKEKLTREYFVKSIMNSKIHQSIKNNSK